MKRSIFRDFKYGVFDIDDTLFDSSTLLLRRWCELLGKIGIPKKISVWIYQKIHHTGMCLDNKLLGLGELLEKIVIHLRVMVWNWLDMEGQTVNVFPGAEELLESIRAVGVKLYVSSLAFEAKKRLARVNLAGYFEEMLGGDVGRKGEHIHTFAQLVGVSRQEFCQNAFSIGDSLQDMVVARQNGLYAIGISTRYSKEQLLASGANRVVKNLADLLNDD